MKCTSGFPIIRQLLKRGIQVMGYFNNHYAGFGPGSIELFGKVWESMKEVMNCEL